MHADDTHRNADEYTLRRSHRENAVHIGNNGVRDVLIQPGHLHRRERDDLSGAISPVFTLTKQEKQNDKGDQGIDGEPREIAEDGRPETDHTKAHLLGI